MNALHTGLTFLLFAFAALFGAKGAESSNPLAKAQTLFEARDDAAAQRAFEAMAIAEPSNPEPPRFLGRLALRRNDPNKAVSWFEKAAALAPTQAEVYCELGDSYGRLAQKAGVLSKFGLAKKCLASYQRAVTTDPASVRGHESLFGYYLNAPAIAGGGADKALAEAGTLRQLNRGRGELAFAQLRQSEKKYDAALAHYDAYLQSAPNDSFVHYQVGKLCDTAHIAPERGLAALRRCLELPPLTPPEAPKHMHAHWRIGNILRQQGDLAGARGEYEAALKIDPTFSPASAALKEVAARKL